ncbi:hypothetical protein BpHYR1_043503 [Brachionus plicatilis]|uniref:Uncharacterized protein n=1 Tax=Brachionus plicatilis TaxID=10195 RepID=A0A3M7PRA1_BRAPC|nr:hypothetical protein BpHYR1_043503 [Brachionus plicatilis]
MWEFHVQKSKERRKCDDFGMYSIFSTTYSENILDYFLVEFSRINYVLNLNLCNILARQSTITEFKK